MNFNHSAPSLRNAYLTRLFERVCQTDLSGLDRSGGGEQRSDCPNLSEIYTALLTTETVREKNSKKEYSFEPDERERPKSALEALNDHQRLVLLGEPGSGKSTFVNFVALCLAGEQLGRNDANLTILTAPLPTDEGERGETPQPWRHGRLFPIKLVLRDVAASGIHVSPKTGNSANFWAYLEHLLREWHVPKFRDELETILLNEPTLICFDGLDEVPEAEHRREQMLEMIRACRRAYPNAHLLVTCRTYAYQQQKWQLPECKNVTLAPFSKGQIAWFIERWYAHEAASEMREEQAKGRAARLKDAIFDERRPQLFDFAQRPLLLTIMTILHAYGGDLPEDRGDLYRDATDVLLERWERKKVVIGDDGVTKLEPMRLTEVLNIGKKTLLKTLGQLAYEAHAAQPNEQKGTADISGKRLLEALMESSPDDDLPPNLLKRHLSDRAGLLIERGVNVYAFPHRSFQEYLAAYYLYEHDDTPPFPENIAELIHRDSERWREVVLLNAQMCNHAGVWQLVEQLCPFDVSEMTNEKAADAYGALFAAQALAETIALDEVRNVLYLKTKEKIRRWLKAILTEGTAEPLPARERALAGNLLAIFGDDRTGVGIDAKTGLPEIDWITIPAGEFWMGSEKTVDKDADDNEQPRHRVTFREPFQMSRYPITNAQYKAFVDDNGYLTESYWTKEGWAWRGKENVTAPRWWNEHDVFHLSNHPVIGVSWYEAMAFCAWLTITSPPAPSPKERGELSPPFRGGAGGGVVRLPTEAEWEYAARGPGEAYRRYPWCDEMTPEHANYNETNIGATSAVGGFPQGKSAFDCEEMAGNVWEWCLDSYLKRYNNASGNGEMRGNIGDKKAKVLRGGSYDDNAIICRSAVRYRSVPAHLNHNIGFRVVVAAR